MRPQDADVGILERLAKSAGYTRLTRGVAHEYASAWSDNSHLADITLRDFLGFAADYIRVNYKYAMKVSTIAAGRNTIAGTLGRLPIYAEQSGVRAQQQWPLFAQFQNGVPNVTLLTWTYTALIFEPHTWWRVLERDYYKWPTKVEWISAERATVDEFGNVIEIDQAPVTDQADIIRFDSPLGSGLLHDADRTIRRAVAIELAAALAEDNPVPTVELHNEGADLTSDEREGLLNAWSASRRRRGVAYTPKNVKVIPHGQYVSQLLIEGRRAINLDLIRAMNLPAWAASTAVEGATMTYDNRQLRNWELIDLTLAPYMAAVAGRLSMNDITPRGWIAKVDTDELTRPDQKTRFETYRIGLGDKSKPGFITQDWIAAQEGWQKETNK